MKTSYTPQEADVWNMTYSHSFVELLDGGYDDDEAAPRAIELAGRAVEALRRAQKRLG